MSPYYASLNNMAYVVELWRKAKPAAPTGLPRRTFNEGAPDFLSAISYQPVSHPSTSSWQLMDTLIPTRHGRPLPFIPFIFHGPEHSRPAVARRG